VRDFVAAVRIAADVFACLVILKRKMRGGIAFVRFTTIPSSVVNVLGSRAAFALLSVDKSETESLIESWMIKSARAHRAMTISAPSAITRRDIEHDCLGWADRLENRRSRNAARTSLIDAISFFLLHNID